MLGPKGRTVVLDRGYGVPTLINSGVNVAKDLVQHPAQGPLFMAKLPAGAYTANASFRDQSQTRKFQVRLGRLHTEYLRWPTRPDEYWTLLWGAP